MLIACGLLEGVNGGYYTWSRVRMFDTQQRGGQSCESVYHNKTMRRYNLDRHVSPHCIYKATSVRVH
jgi:hypothetical protein